jgi:hypothetical protein
MPFLKLYLAAYYVLLFGAALALWESGVLRQIPPLWIALAFVIAVGLGIVLALVSRTHVIAKTPDTHA